MSCFTSRCILIVVCILQLVSIVERQVFDFLGYMWVPIIVNFLQIIFVIIGLFGAIQYRPKVVVVYTIWCLLWLGWNIFVICFYLQVGILSRDDDVLNIGTGNKSWWLEHGLGCKVTNDTWANERDESSDAVRISPPEQFVEGCTIQYYYIETIHAGIQVLLTLLGLCASCIVIYVFTEEDDSSQAVHGELEYIKMRYRSPARNSFRDTAKHKKINRAYDTVTTQTTTFSGSRGDSRDHHGSPLATNYNSDESIDRQHDVTSSTHRIVTTDAHSIDRCARNSPANSPVPGSNTPKRDYGLKGSPGGDLGYESYDSRHQLVVVPKVGQTVI